MVSLWCLRAVAGKRSTGARRDEVAGETGRRLHCPRGKVLGGSSSINGMVFVRGHAGDFNHWQSEVSFLGFFHGKLARWRRS